VPLSWAQFAITGREDREEVVDVEIDFDIEEATDDEVEMSNL
jgi:hypothetical protein